MKAFVVEVLLDGGEVGRPVLALAQAHRVAEHTDDPGGERLTGAAPLVEGRAVVAAARPGAVAGERAPLSGRQRVEVGETAVRDALLLNSVVGETGVGVERHGRAPERGKSV